MSVRLHVEGVGTEVTPDGWSLAGRFLLVIETDGGKGSSSGTRVRSGTSSSEEVMMGSGITSAANAARAVLPVGEAVGCVGGLAPNLLPCVLQSLPTPKAIASSGLENKVWHRPWS